MSWNYRMVKHKGSDFIYVTEVYYDKLQRPNGFIQPSTFNPICGENVNELKEGLKYIKTAFIKPIIIIENNKIIGEEIYEI